MTDEVDVDLLDVRPLTALRPGDSARVIRVAGQDPQRLARLSGFGIVPGAIVRLRQKLPAAVIQIAETSVAVDSEVATEIWVKRLD